MNRLAFAIPMPYRGIAAVTLLALLAWTLGLPAWIHSAGAANVVEFSDTLSDSDLGVDANHTIQWELVNTVTEGQTMTLAFDAGSSSPAFDLTGLLSGDVTITAVSGGPINQVANVGACNVGSVAGEVYLSNINTTNDIITLGMCGGSEDDIPASTVVRVVVGGSKVNNPAWPGSYVIRLGGTMTDSGDTRVAIIDDVTVTATVETIFTFSINGVGAGNTINNDTVPTSGTSTATTVPFGILAPNAAKVIAQELRVDTNALNGFSVTVQANQTLTAGNLATIDPFVNGSQIASSTPWAGPAGTMGQTNTYGHWGVTSDDNFVSSSSPNLWGVGTTTGYSLYQGNFINNPVEVFYHNAAVENTAGQGVGSTTVAYKAEIMELQEAANDYTATLTYIATPVF